MKNLDNSLRLYNRKVLRRTKMHLYTKRYIDALFLKAIFKIPKVNLTRWTDADMIQYKLDKNLEKFKDSFSPNFPLDISEYEPPIKKPKVDESGKNVLKLVLSREGETDTFKSQFKTVDDDKENGKKNNKKNGKKNNTDNEKKKNKNNDLENEKNKNNDQNNAKKNDESDDQDNVMPSDHESSNSSTEPMEIASNKPLEPIKSASSSKIGTIWCCDLKNLLEDSKLKEFYECFDLSPKCPLFTDPKPSISNNKLKDKKSPVKTSKNSPVQNSVQTKHLALNEIERLYKKYFSTSVQDNIVIIANILNIISMSNKHHKSRMDESFKKKTEAEKLKERCDANRMHLRHKKVLETKLKKYFQEVISEFVYSEFEPAFQMFFLSILTVLRILDQPKFKKGSIFKNLVLLLWNSLKNSELDHAKVFGMFRSKTFRPDCIDLISLIEDSRDNDPGITDRMSIFFVSSINSQEYFQTVINAVTGDSNEDLGLLIDNAAFQYCLNSKFKSSLDASSSSIIKKNVHATPVTSVPSTSKNDDSFQRWVLAKTPSGTFHPITMTDVKSKKKTPIVLDPSRTSQLSSYYEGFSNSFGRSSGNATVVPKLIVPKGTTFASAPSVSSNGSLQNGSFVAFKPSIQSVKSIAGSPNFSRSEKDTIFVGNKQYHVIRSPANQLRAVSAQNGIVMASMTTVKKTEASIKCFAKSCPNAATIMCSTCRSVKYCSHNCQRQDWYESHISNCERLNTIRLDREKTLK